MRIAQRSVVNFSTQIAASVIGFVVTVYLANTLGAGPLGVYFLVIAVVIWLKILGGMGVQSAIIKRVSEHGDSEAYVTAGIVLQGLMFVIILTILFLAEDLLLAYLRGVTVMLLIPLLIAGLSLSFVMSVLDGYHLVHLSSLLTPLERIVRGFSQVALVLLGFTVGGLLAGYAVGATVAAVGGILLMPGGLSRPKRRHFEELLSYAKYSWVSKLSSRAFASMDTVVLGIFVGSSLIGVYEIAWNLASLLAIFGISITRTMFPEISRLSTGSQLNIVSERLTDGIRFSGLMLLPGLVGSLVLGERVLAIYGGEFIKGDKILIILIVSRLIYAYAAQFVNTLNAIDRPELGFWINGTFVVTNIVLNLFLIWQFGWIGAAIATAISALLSFVMGYEAVSRQLDFQFPLWGIGRQGFAAIGMGAVLYFVDLHAPEGLLFTIGLVFGGAAIYFAVLASISSTFRYTVQANLPFLNGNSE